MNSGDTSGEEIINAKPIDSNLNDNFPKFTYFELWWSSSENERRKSITIYNNGSSPFHIDQFISDWTEKCMMLLYFIFSADNREFSYSLHVKNKRIKTNYVCYHGLNCL